MDEISMQIAGLVTIYLYQNPDAGPEKVMQVFPGLDLRGEGVALYNLAFTETMKASKEQGIALNSISVEQLQEEMRSALQAWSNLTKS